ncbi:hypothetical protein SLEP1_g57807 [Rubroshorea leprosula]|uniref:Uncharacterized protein n=1 Tax=Rubroshorea leprosula TaxID=152421 RepID=A0AAV5MNZ4_9ROSI|nr:hypothetical protein SLEP1_g57807 [Rubroshorea leprosula]
MAEFENSWCSDDFAILDDSFSKNTQFLGAAKRVDDPQHFAHAEIQTFPNLPLCGSQVVSGNNDTGQVEGGNIENGTTDMGLEVEINPSRAVLSPIAEVQLVDVPLSHQLGDMRNHTGKGTTTKANKSN